MIGGGALEQIDLRIGGRSWKGFQTIDITYSVNMAARTARVTGSDLAGSDKINPGDEASITAGGDLILTGYVGDVSPHHDGENHSVSFEIASRAIDAVEASIDHPTGQIDNKPLNKIAEEFDTCGVGIICTESFPAERTSIRALGDSLVDHIRPLARSHGAFIYDTEEGKLRIAKKPRGTHSGAIAIGINIISGSATISEKGRHDEIIVRGQSSRGTGKAALQIESKAKDSGVKRRRPIIIVHESEATAGKLKERADRYARRAAGYSREATIEVSGWRDEGGLIWQPHFLVYVRDPRLYTDQMMAIKDVSLSQQTTAGSAGTRARLSLVDPAALNGEAGGGSSKFETPQSKAKVNL